LPGVLTAQVTPEARLPDLRPVGHPTARTTAGSVSV
jgi:hypothetical protein